MLEGLVRVGIVRACSNGSAVLLPASIPAISHRPLINGLFGLKILTNCSAGNYSCVLPRSWHWNLSMLWQLRRQLVCHVVAPRVPNDSCAIFQESWWEILAHWPPLRHSHDMSRFACDRLWPIALPKRGKQAGSGRHLEWGSTRSVWAEPKSQGFTTK